jgi:H+/Cl- antiporter ClcA
MGLFSLVSGLLAGLAATVFLKLLEWATQIRIENPVIIWALPIAGLFTGLLYHKFGQSIERGNNLILDEIHDPRNIIPVSMAPMILLATIITHLFGGSAGREGTAVQMGASLADQLGRIFKFEATERKILLVAGVGAGFGAAIGAPWAGVFFGMEVINVGRLKVFAWLECVLASLVGYHITNLLGVPHFDYPTITMEPFSFKIIGFILLAGIVFGLASRFFVLTTHLVERLHSRFILYPPFRPFFAGLFIVLLFYLEGSYRYAGLGIQYITEALTVPGSFRDPALKTLFSALTVGSGFKGGEFIPLVFIGTSLGSALSFILPVSFKLLAAVGFVSVFAAAANTPIACSIMAMEIFGISIAPYAIVGCFAAYYVSGNRGIYKSQKLLTKKQHLSKDRLRYILQCTAALPPIKAIKRHLFKPNL